MSTATPQHSPSIVTRSVTMARHDDYRVYSLSGFRVTMGMPRTARLSSGPSDYAWFAGLHKYPNGNILCRWSYNADANTAGITKGIISTDSGLTWPTASIYQNDGKPSPLGPMIMESDGVLRGPEFWQWDWPGASRKAVRCGYVEISNGGATYTYTDNGVTVSGFPENIGEQFGAGFPAISWTDRVHKYGGVYYSTVQPLVVDEYQVYSYAVSSPDLLTWTVVGRLNGHIGGNEGFSEVASFRVAARWWAICRIGVASVARVYSDDNGVTWSEPDFGIHAWCKSPAADVLGSGDILLTTGYCDAANSLPLDNRFARVQMGVYLSSTMTADRWPVVDLLGHHNAMVHTSLKYNEAVDVPTGYSSWVELSSTATTSNVLISYDQVGGTYGYSTRANRIFVVNALIERV